MKKCPVCNFYLKDYCVDNNGSYYCHCYRCGKYFIAYEAQVDFHEFITSASQMANLSGWIYKNQEELITSERLSRLSKLRTPNVDEKANRILLFLSELCPIPGERLPSIFKTIQSLLELDLEELQPHHIESAEMMLPVMSLGNVSTIEELYYLLFDYLYDEKKYLDLVSIDKITPKGWAFIESNKSRNPESNNVFIAMKFEDSLKEFSEKWVESAIRETGFDSIRIDKYEHNNLIDDEIIANIRRSRFLIADLTGNSYGVYYEAGFARGLGLPVIYLCQEEYFKSDDHKVHFDTNHYPFILWNEKQGEVLKNKLKNRIEATIGFGAKVEEA